MSSKNLDQPLLEGGIRNTHFFQGRLLTAEDLRAEQEANRQHHRFLGRALGAGVVDGLDVRLASPGNAGSAPVIVIRRGLALNDDGQALTLTRDTKIALSTANFEAANNFSFSSTDDPTEGGGDSGDTPTSDGRFSACQPPVSDPLSVDAAAYILVMSPASGLREQAPRSGLGEAGLGEAGVASSCGGKWVVEGISFALRRLLPSEISGITEATQEQIDGLISTSSTSHLSLLRNLLAHACFGTEEIAGFANNPFARQAGVSPYLSHGALADLRRNGRLRPCDVPLGLIHWTPTGVQFVDTWSVRRRPVPRPPTEQWPTLAQHHRRAEAEAVLLQFHHQVEELLNQVSDPSALRATSYFRYLPPAAFFPLNSVGNTGLSDSEFFHGLPQRQAISLEASRFDALVRRSYEHPPLDLSDAEPLWLYQVLSRGSATEAVYSVFARASVAFEEVPVSNTQTVPNLFGKSLSAAQDLLTLEQFDLRLGTVLDIHGDALNGEDASVQNRVVLGQTPQPRTLVAAGSSIQVAVTAEATATTPELLPAIGQYSAYQVRTGDALTIFGANFATNPADNLVAFTTTDENFAFVEETTPAQNGSTSSVLNVVVPSQLPEPAAGITRQVQLQVRLPSGATADGPPLTLQPPPALIPQIDEVTPNPVNEGDSLTILGQHFDHQPAGTLPTHKTVLFGNVVANPSAASASSISVVVPDLGLPSTSITQMALRVVVDGEPSAIVNHGIRGLQPPPPPPTPTPRIDRFSPTNTVRGNNVTIYGAHFNNDHTQNEVFFNTRKVIPSHGSSTHLVVRVPIDLLPGHDADFHTFAVKVKANGITSSPVNFLVADFVPPPVEDPGDGGGDGDNPPLVVK